jgi:AraC-like DNA-binding protein
VAELANLTVPAFCNYFKKNLNQTFTDFVNEYRVNHACKLLNEGRTVADACFESGFNNVSYFGRVFKKLKQVQPSQFALQNRTLSSERQGFTKIESVIYDFVCFKNLHDFFLNDMIISKIG